MKKSTSMLCRSKCDDFICHYYSDVMFNREQLIHQLKLDEKEHEEKIEREKSKRKAKVQVKC